LFSSRDRKDTAQCSRDKPRCLSPTRHRKEGGLVTSPPERGAMPERHLSYLSVRMASSRSSSPYEARTSRNLPSSHRAARGRSASCVGRRGLGLAVLACRAARSTTPPVRLQALPPA